ncbi:MAG: response regulator [Thermoguttaceae bacterium]
MADGLRLLVVDDEEVVCRACRRILSGQGFQVDTSSDVREALSLATEKDYAAVLVDIKMPGMDGLQLVRELRRCKPDLPAIFITGFPDIASAVSAVRLGVADYVSKPFSPEEITQAVQRALRPGRLGARVPTAEGFQAGQRLYLAKTELPGLIARLQRGGRTLLGPKLTDGVVGFQPIQSAADLACAVQDEQNAGRYSTGPGDPESYFQYGVGPDGPKRYLFPPVQPLFRLHVEEGRFVLDEGPPPAPTLALFGVRPCELAALSVLDRVFGSLDQQHFRCELDAYYKQAREKALIVAVNCTRPGGTCFCASMGTGPRATSGFDLALTELRLGFVVEIGSSRGAELLEAIAVREPSAAELELADVRLEQASSRMGRYLEVEGLQELLSEALEDPAWQKVAKRCLGCGNCTMVCPTCFCSTVVDSSSLDTRTAGRTRYWESCFTHQFSYTTAGPVRSSIRARYRHWLRHKLCTWYEQFGCSGCVGCGRCITWCPVGIDLTKEVAAIRAGRDRAATAGASEQESLR